MLQVTIGDGGFWSPPVVAAIITASAAVVTGIVVSFIALRQWQTAQNKLALDLFDRRLIAWRAIQDKLGERMDEIFEAREQERQPAFAPPSLHDLWRELDDARFLFGPEVHTAFQELDDAIFALGGASPNEKAVYEFSPGRMRELDAYTVGLDRLNKARAALRAAVEPYMNMQHIGVAKPRRLKPEQTAPA